LRNAIVIDAWHIYHRSKGHPVLFHKNILLSLGTMTALLAFVSWPALAEENSPPADSPAVADPGKITNGELVRFEGFLDQHPAIEARLRESPALVGDPAFLKNHPQFAEFLASHPGIQAELAAEPRWFIHRELIRQSATPVTRDQIVEFDRFLDQHPELAKQLAQHPQLLRQADFLNGHPELHEYLKQHPGIARAAESKPGNLIKRADKPKPKVRVKP
jgi:hypothetical protein